jgi:hypothetical protein
MAEDKTGDKDRGHGPGTRTGGRNGDKDLDQGGKDRGQEAGE